MFLWLSFQNFQPRLRCIWSEAVQLVCSTVNYVNIRLELRETLPDTLNQDIWICNTLATFATRSWKQNEVSNNIWKPVILINTMQLTFKLSYSNLRHKGKICGIFHWEFVKYSEINQISSKIGFRAISSISWDSILKRELQSGPSKSRIH